MSKYLKLCEPRTALLDEEASSRKIHGFGLALDWLDGYEQDARLLDLQELSIDRLARTEGVAGDRVRFRLINVPRFAEKHYTAIPVVADAFFADKRTAEFVWQACLEKIGNDPYRGLV